MSIVTIEEQGRTVEEAIDAGLKRLHALRDEVTVEVLDEGSTGLLNLVKGRPARVRIQMEREEVALDTAKAWLETALEHLGFEDFSVTGEQKGEYLRFDIHTNGREDTGLLIGREGENINALQHILSKVVNHDQSDKIFVVLDTEDYRARRVENLEREAINLARKVKKSGRPVLSDMLNPHDRRIIHMKLSEDSQIETNSLGEGFYKQIKISLAAAGAGVGSSYAGHSSDSGSGAPIRRRRR